MTDTRSPSPDPRDPRRDNALPSDPPPVAEVVCTRVTPRQATSAVAYVGEEPGDDDPLLGFAPYLHPVPRGNSITPERQRRFVATLAATGIVSQAARAIGKSMEALYKLRHKPGAEGFAAAWDAALERGMQRLEDCALERSLKGTPTPIVSGGKLLGTWDKPDNNLLRFMLQHRRSGRYGVQNIQPGHPVYEAIKQEVLEAEAARERDEKEEVIASVDKFIEGMRQRRLANARLLAGEEAEEEQDAFRDSAPDAWCAPAGDWSGAE